MPAETRPRKVAKELRLSANANKTIRTSMSQNRTRCAIRIIRRLLESCIWRDVTLRDASAAPIRNAITAARIARRMSRFFHASLYRLAIEARQETKCDL